MVYLLLFGFIHLCIRSKDWFFHILLRDLDEVVKRSQEPMTKVLMVECGKKRVLEACDNVEERQMKKRKLKEAVTEAKINELSYKNFSVESKKI